ncbi:uncharacterized protein MCYG_05176 [Microsporum canis CBS 113480]|uniref:Uncharacterized protein n=1 Tax=Arthroderma otae (strain ATCC MYA-4605 / CBS 113480) TaxID=554155 RepID=C5FR54_ARTOC|nr:uncharacterized protein MCYG_05176 [Microsporum canis CBS 113480]EEQ32357.1 predicted protein [Microsporum canis CBS 113480]
MNGLKWASYQTMTVEEDVGVTPSLNVEKATSARKRQGRKNMPMSKELLIQDNRLATLRLLVLAYTLYGVGWRHSLRGVPCHPPHRRVFIVRAGVWSQSQAGRLRTSKHVMSGFVSLDPAYPGGRLGVDGNLVEI